MPNFSSFWSDKAGSSGSISRLAFADPADPRVAAAAHRLIETGIAHPILLGDERTVGAACREAGVAMLSADHLAGELGGADRERYLAALRSRTEKFKISESDLEQRLSDPLYRGVAMLLEGDVDGLVAGSLRPTADIVRAAIQCVGPRKGQHLISGQFLLEAENRATLDRTPFLLADCAVVPEPSSRALAAIAVSAAASYRFFTGQTPRVALLSFSTRGSAQHPLVDRIREAVRLAKQQDPELIVDGEIQADAALDFNVAKIKKADDSPVAGKANVFVFPTLEAGNVGYKLVQRFASVRIAGPLLWGLARPMSDLSRGCTVQEIADTARCVAVMAQGLH